MTVDEHGRCGRLSRHTQASAATMLVRKVAEVTSPVRDRRAGLQSSALSSPDRTWASGLSFERVAYRRTLRLRCVWSHQHQSHSQIRRASSKAFRTTSPPAKDSITSHLNQTFDSLPFCTKKAIFTAKAPSGSRLPSMANGVDPESQSLTNCRFYEEKYPEIESFVMVNVKQVRGFAGHFATNAYASTDRRNGRICQTPRIRQHRWHDPPFGTFPATY